MKTGISSGSGFIFDKYGHIITNNHVIEDAVEVEVTYDGKREKAVLVGKSDKNDIAILSLNSNKQIYKHLAFCDNEPNIGQNVIAIGNPFGFDQSVSTGSISGLHRTLDGDTTLLNMIQTDTAINPGNSGGPLIDADRQCVIGMTTAMVSPGVGFAIPSTDLKYDIDMILNHKQGNDILGVELLPDDLNQALGLPGVAVVDVIEGSIAKDLGIVGTSRNDMGVPVFGDIITSINGKDIEKQKDIKEALYHQSIKQIEIVRGNTRITLAKK